MQQLNWISSLVWFDSLNVSFSSQLMAEFIWKVDDIVVENVTTVVHGILFDNEIPFPLENPNACLDGIACPLTKGNILTYVQSLPVKIYYPPVSITFLL